MRSVNDRIAWFRNTPPMTVGMCLRHTWQATDIPAAGAADANAGVTLVRQHKQMNTDRNPPRGAWVWWTSPTHGHVCLSLGDRMLLSTDVKGPATTGTVPLGYPEAQWGHTYAGWSSWYGQPFTVAPTSAQRRRRLARLRARIRKLTHRKNRVRAHLH